MTIILIFRKEIENRYHRARQSINKLHKPIILHLLPLQKPIDDQNKHSHRQQNKSLFADSRSMSHSQINF